MSARIASLFIVLMFAVVAITPSAMAQKAAKAEKSKPAPQAEAGMIKDVLVKWEGKSTNLGTLKKVHGDYFVVEEEGATMMHPLHAIHTIKLWKDEETGEEKMEIRLVGKD
jgi:hypothetical protein